MMMIEMIETILNLLIVDQAQDLAQDLALAHLIQTLEMMMIEEMIEISK